MAIATHASAFKDGSEYEETLGVAHSYYIGVKARLLKSIVARMAPESARFLDLGCGTGEMAQALVGNGWTVHGVDLSPGMIAHAQAKGIPGATFSAGDAADTDLPADDFDVVFATALMHHVPPQLWDKVMDEMRRVLKPGGLLVIFEHNTHNPVTRRMVATCSVDEDAVLLSPRTMVNLFRTHELKVVWKRYLLFFPYFLRALTKTERLLHHVPMGGQYVVVGRK